MTLWKLDPKSKTSFFLLFVFIPSEFPTEAIYFVSCEIQRMWISLKLSSIQPSIRIHFKILFFYSSLFLSYKHTVRNILIKMRLYVLVLFLLLFFITIFLATREFIEMKSYSKNDVIITIICEREISAENFKWII